MPSLQTLQQLATLPENERDSFVQRNASGDYVQQARDYVAADMEHFDHTEEEAKKALLSHIANAAENKGGDPQTVYSSFPQPLKNYLQYTPEDLKRNQDITVFASLLAPLLFLTGGGLILGAAIRGLPLIAATLARVAAIGNTPKTAATIANEFHILRSLTLQKLAVPGIISAALGALGWWANGLANNWNDVFHWGPLLSQQNINKALGGAGGTRPTGIGAYTPTLTKSKTAKPKVFIGTIMGGRVLDVPDFVRKADDEITDEEDLRNDISINLVNWMKALPDMMSWEAQVKLNPFDENQVRKTGHWVTLGLYLTTKIGKRMFIDEILLGPIDPIKYWPETVRTETVRIAVSNDLIPSDLKPSKSADGKVTTVDNEGNVVTLFEEPAAPPAAAPAPSAPVAPVVQGVAPAPAAAPTPAPAPVFTPAPSIASQVFSTPQFGSSGVQTTTPQFAADLNRGTGAQPISAQQAIQRSLVVDTSSGAATGSSNSGRPTHRVNTGGQNLNVRVGPGLNNSVQDKLPDGTGVVHNDSFSQMADGYRWIRVQYSANGTQRTGYIADAFIVSA